MNVRMIKEEDFPQVIAMNNDFVPAVTLLDHKKLMELKDQAQYIWIIEFENSICGFSIILPPGASYDSDNYRWFSDRYSDFQYLDRVVIASEYQRKGLGRKVYDHWFAHSKGLPLLLEVNIKPMNEGSIKFHQKMGFLVAGEQDTEGGKKRVQYFVKELPPS